MKKEYSKPVVVFENFSLSTSIAANCEFKTNLLNAEEQCGYPIRGSVVFMTGIAGCKRIEDDGDYNGVCYHVPHVDFNLFNS